MPQSPLNLWASTHSATLATISLTGAGAKGTGSPQGYAFSPKEVFSTASPLQQAGAVFLFHCLFDQALIHSKFPLPTHPFIRSMIDLLGQVFIWCKLALLHWFLWVCVDLCQLRIWSIFMIFEHQSLHPLFPSVGFFCRASEKKKQMS